MHETPESRILTARRVVKDGYSPQELYLTGAEQTAASDLYALGATFYHVISGKPPPPSQRRLLALASGAPDPCLPLSGRFPGYPPGFLESIDSALRVLQKDRLQSASEWIALIEDGHAQSASTSPAAAALPPLAQEVTGQSTENAGFLSHRPDFLLLGGAIVLVLALGGLWAVLS